MRKVIGIIIFVIAIGILIFLVYKIVTKARNQKEHERIVQTLPSCNFDLICGQKLASKQIKNKPAVVVFYNPGCNHCEYEGEMFYANKNRLKDIDIVMISSSPTDSIRAYVNRHKLNDVLNFYFVTDSRYEAFLLWNVKTIPSVYIYNKEGVMVKLFNGEVKLDAILDELN